MKIGVTERFKIGDTCCDRGCNVSKNIAIPLIPDSPTSRDEDFHLEMKIFMMKSSLYLWHASDIMFISCRHVFQSMPIAHPKL
jgi:hypothetical protein